MTLIKIYGQRKWKEISQKFYDKTRVMRTAKQCRDRWFNVLVAQKRCKIGPKDRFNIFGFFQVFGTQWSKISKLMPKFTENELKNFINATVRRNIRRFNKNKGNDQKIEGKNLCLLNIPELQNVIFAEKTYKQSWFDSIFISHEILAKVKKESCDEYIIKELKSFPLIEDKMEIISSPIFLEYETELPCEDLFS